MDPNNKINYMSSNAQLMKKNISKKIFIQIGKHHQNKIQIRLVLFTTKSDNYCANLTINIVGNSNIYY